MQKETSNIRSEYLFAGLMCIAVAIFIVILIVCGSCQADEHTTSVSSADSSSEGSLDLVASVPSAEESTPVSFDIVEVASEGKTSGMLVLTTLPAEGEPTEPSDLVTVYGKNEHYNLSGSSLQLTSEALNALNRMTADFAAAKGKNNLLLDKAYTKAAKLDDRSVQADLTNGNSVQLSVYPVDPDGDYIGGGKFLWLNDNCFHYGYILRYPTEKESATHVSGAVSRRIYRYVGEAHAAYMGTYHLCLEEYLDALRGFSPEHPLEISYKDAAGNEKTCFVYYVAVDGETTQIPVRADSAASYTVSGNGTDGFVVTCYPEV